MKVTERVTYEVELSAKELDLLTSVLSVWRQQYYDVTCTTQEYKDYWQRVNGTLATLQAGRDLGHAESADIETTESAQPSRDS